MDEMLAGNGRVGILVPHVPDRIELDTFFAPDDLTAGKEGVATTGKKRVGRPFAARAKSLTQKAYWAIGA